MQVNLQGSPSATFTLTSAEAYVLMRCSATHYDSVCIQASAPGGFIARWHRVTTSEDPVFGREVYASFDELDTSLKCMELRCIGSSEQDHKIQLNLFYKFRQICQKMNEMHALWQCEFSANAIEAVKLSDAPGSNSGQSDGSGWTEP
jgi:hypothetical protein